ncbi:MAG TPA: exodeoxyribonuclease VII large subunit [Thermoanaerobaculia bacterium]|nr:exodeoxyribonuclease VII large subunit [Thermoanaerobaculia bacterium]
MTQPELLPPDTYSVSQLGSELQRFVSMAFAALWVGGEVQRPRAARSGHLYFELVEKGPDDEILGKLDAVLWRRDHMRVRAALRRVGAHIEEGSSLRCFGSLDFFPPAGRMQLVVRDVDPLFALGALAQRRRATLEELQRAGLLERNRSLSLAPVPLRLGLVASRESAGAADFLETLRASGFGFELRWLDVRVQGATAESDLCAALAWLERRARLRGDLDAVVIVRGGGARADLAAFDSRRVALQVAQAPVPVLTGIGHHVDRAVADEVAHSAFKTPTEVAEFLVRRVATAESRLDEAAARMVRAAGLQRDRTTRRLERVHEGLRGAWRRAARDAARTVELSERLARIARRRLHRAERELGRVSAVLLVLPRRRLEAAHATQGRVTTRLMQSSGQRLRAEAQRVAVLERLCRQLGPERTLARGFSITRDASGRLVRRAEEVRSGDVLVTELATGRLRSRVEDSQ